ncbi:MAG: hypothetical protein HY054_11315 [Proteobacteria bacterium]|nr:hypothetical protein [Pseudomonadota bacterium]
MEDATKEERAAYVADFASQLADLIADLPYLCARLRMLALEAALVAEGKSER